MDQALDKHIAKLEGIHKDGRTLQQGNSHGKITFKREMAGQGLAVELSKPSDHPNPVIPGTPYNLIGRSGRQNSG